MSVQILEVHTAQQLKNWCHVLATATASKGSTSQARGNHSRKGTVTKNGEGLGIRANDHGGGPVAEILACVPLTRNLKLESRA